MYKLLRELEFHFFFGLKSGIPICCVLFFLLRYLFNKLLCRDGWCTGIWINCVTYNVERITGVNFNYSPCPICLITGHKHELLECEPDFKI